MYRSCSRLRSNEEIEREGEMVGKSGQPASRNPFDPAQYAQERKAWRKGWISGHEQFEAMRDAAH